ncbi:hypothetical protein BD769DRAFT_1675630 [Suillus cothurnatus]|nr:hypothetical protein BD769DRAFT_1675630 [Suillus cothurnatus]
MSFMLDGRNVSVVRDHSSSHSLVAMSFVSLDRSRDGVFRALVTLLKGDVRLSTQFLFTVRDTLPTTVVLGRDWFAFCRDILHSHPELVPLDVRSHQSPIHASCVAPLGGTILGALALIHDRPLLACASRSPNIQGRPEKTQLLIFTGESPAMAGGLRASSMTP